MKETVVNGEVEVTQKIVRTKDNYLQEQEILLADIAALQGQIDLKNLRLQVVSDLLAQL